MLVRAAHDFSSPHAFPSLHRRADRFCMRYSMILLWMFAGAVLADGVSTTIVAPGSSTVCRRDEKEALYWARMDANLNATDLCDKFGGSLKAQWKLPPGEKTGNPIDSASCSPCDKGGVKCTVRMLPQTCSTSSSEPVSNANWNAPLRKTVVLSGVSMSCQAAVRYRDDGLVSALDRNLKQFRAATDSLALLDSLDQEMRWQKPKMMVNGVLLHATLQLKTVGELIGDLLSINPETGVMIDAARAGSRKLERLFTAADAVGKTEALLLDDEEFQKYILTELAGEVNPIGAALKTAVHYADNIRDISDTAKDTKATWGAMEASSATLRKTLSKLAVKARSAETRMRLLNDAQNEIAQYCAERQSDRIAPPKMPAPAVAIREPNEGSEWTSMSRDPSSDVACRNAKEGAGQKDSPGKCDCQMRNKQFVCKWQYSGPTPAITVQALILPQVRSIRKLSPCNPNVQTCLDGTPRRVGPPRS